MKHNLRRKVFNILGSLILLSPIGLFAQTPIKYGDCLQGSINLAGQIDSYAFAGNAGDVVTIMMGCSNYTFHPKIEVYSGATLLKTVSDSTFTSVRIDTFKLAATGSYTILAMDRDGNSSGDYGISVQRLNPGQGKPLSYGISALDSLKSPGALRVFTFTGASNDIVTVITGGDSNLRPQIGLYSPSGVLLANTIATWSNSRINALRLPAGGTYTIIAQDLAGVNTGGFGLTVQRLNPAVGKAITYSGAVADTLKAFGDLKAFTFTGAAGDILTIQLGQTGTSYSVHPEIELYSPAGVLLKKTFDSTGASTRITTITLSATGVYSILAFDYCCVNTGTISISVAKIGSGVKDQFQANTMLSFDVRRQASGGVIITYSLPGAMPVTAALFNASGKSVGILENGMQRAGTHAVQVNTGRFPAGVYFCRFQAQGLERMSKFEIVK